MKARTDSLLLIAMLTSLAALGPLSTDLYLPSLPAISRAFGADTGATQLTLSIFVAGFAVSQLVYGPLSDRFGRRPVLLLGLSLYIAASLLCMLANSIESLIAARFLQALGACSGPILGRAVVRDVFPRSKAAQVLSYVAMAMALAPAMGPILGGYLEILLGWRSAFALLAVIGGALLALTAMFLPETNRYMSPEATRPARIAANYRMLFADRTYRGYMLVQTLAFSGLFSFISGSSFVLIEVVGLTPDQFGLSFTSIVAGFMTGAFASGRLTRRVGLDRMILAGLFFCFAGAMPMALLGFTGYAEVLTIVLPMIVYMAGAGMVLPNAMAAAIGPYPHMAGSASALLGFVQMGTAALVGAAVGHFADGTPRSMVGAIAIVATLALLAFAWQLRRRRLAAAGAALPLEEAVEEEEEERQRA